jgi:hypothetical protein
LMNFLLCADATAREPHVFPIYLRCLLLLMLRALVQCSCAELLW